MAFSFVCATGERPGWSGRLFFNYSTNYSPRSVKKYFPGIYCHWTACRMI